MNGMNEKEGRNEQIDKQISVVQLLEDRSLTLTQTHRLCRE